ncbi:MAG: hypothetical protein B9S34_03800 [Opitutia bacterium Tous-C1TDCM]|nr:MAG: hypothetical protein B9S34_03800 [Opitutae bacterium Tous-C1TDCM]
MTHLSPRRRLHSRFPRPLFSTVVTLALAFVAAASASAASAAVPRTVAEATPSWPAPARPPAGSPDVLLVVLDDIGFAQLGCYGSPIPTPNIDRLAAGGVRYTNFTTFPVCSPTRAALLTGRNPHSAGVGVITEFANGFPHSRGGLAPEAATVAELLRASGYGTAAVGKWHLIPQQEQNAASPPTHWPTGRGFDRFYGYLGGDTNHFAPDLFQDRHRIDPPVKLRDGSPYFLDADLTDRAIGYIADHRAAAPDRPYFLYLAYCAGHAPHHAPPDYLEKWRGRFDAGWDAVRAATLARQKEMGLVPADVVLPPHNPGVRPWAALSADERRVFARYYEAFAANLEYTDRQLGRLLDELERTGRLRDTLVILLSDNGASPEGGEFGLWNEMQLFNAQQSGTLREGLERLDALGGPQTFGTYPLGWTQAGNTPFRLTKGFIDAGGIRVPLVVHWPARIPQGNTVRRQFHFVTDVAATILEAAGTAVPATFHGVPQLPLHGTGLAYAWDRPDAPTARPTQYYELYGRRGIQHGPGKQSPATPRASPTSATPGSCTIATPTSPKPATSPPANPRNLPNSKPSGNARPPPTASSRSTTAASNAISCARPSTAATARTSSTIRRSKACTKAPRRTSAAVASRSPPRSTAAPATTASSSPKAAVSAATPSGSATAASPSTTTSPASNVRPSSPPPSCPPARAPCPSNSSRPPLRPAAPRSSSASTAAKSPAPPPPAPCPA